jgi:RNA polymerase sigma-70 factor (ECF subfamily)
VSEPETGQAWVQGARAGSADDFARLVRLHGQALRAFLRRLTGNAAEADDLAQDAFVFAWEQIGRFDPARDFRPWLFAIAWRKYRERQRGWRRLLMRQGRAIAAQPQSETPDPGLRLDLATACAALPVEQRAALLLCLGCDFTHAEAAEALALPLGTVKSHVARGREKLAAFLGDAQ